MASMTVPPCSFVLTFCWASVCWRGSKKITRGICLITLLINKKLILFPISLKFLIIFLIHRKR